MDATRKDGKIRISMAGGDADKSYSVLVQVRGILALAKTLRLGGVLSLDRNSLPAGVAQILLLDDSGNVLSERLIFGGNPVQNMAIRTDKNRYCSRELVKMDLRLMNEGKIRGGNVAVSVTDNSVVARDSSMTILANMLLQSDLRGYIEDMAYYFDAKNEDALNALDELLMTQGVEPL